MQWNGGTWETAQYNVFSVTGQRSRVHESVVIKAEEWIMLKYFRLPDSTWTLDNLFLSQGKKGKFKNKSIRGSI